MNGTNHLRKKYLPNLTEHLACCSTIYQKMIHLLPPTYTVGEIFERSVSDFAMIETLIIEQHTYTDFVVVRFKWIAQSQWLTNLDIQLNLCHDMNLAEITGFISQGKVVNLQVRDNSSIHISYPNEKKQIHHLLLEWLSLSLTS